MSPNDLMSMKMMAMAFTVTSSHPSEHMEDFGVMFYTVFSITIIKTLDGGTCFERIVFIPSVEFNTLREPLTKSSDTVLKV